MSFPQSKFNGLTHQTTLVRGIISTVLNHRSELYAIPALRELAKNGDDRINEKTQQYLRKFVEDVLKVPNGEKLISEEVSKCGGTKRGRGETKKLGAGTPKKRKVQTKVEDGSVGSGSG